MTASPQEVWELSRLALADHDGDVVVLRVFMDESGTHAGSPIVTVAAYMGRPKVWRDWTAKWARTLRPIRVYHAVDAQNLDNEFEDWTHERVAELVKKLLPIIAETEIASVTVGMDLRAYEAAMKGRDDLRAIFGTPYIACFQWAVQIILNLANQAKNNERIAFVHEVNDFKGAAMDAFAWVKEHDPNRDRITSLTFGSKADYPPLQTADILAYETNKRLRNVDAPERRPWAALKANTFAVQYGENNMATLVDSLEKIRDGRVAEVNPGLGWNRSWVPR